MLRRSADIRAHTQRTSPEIMSWGQFSSQTSVTSAVRPVMATDVMTSASAHHPEPTGNMAVAERVALLLVAVRESTDPLRGAVGHLRRMV